MGMGSEWVKEIFSNATIIFKLAEVNDSEFFKAFGHMREMKNQRGFFE